MQDLHDLLSEVPVYVEDSYSEEDEADSDDVLPADLRVLLKYDPYLSLRPFTEAQSRAYYAMMPVTHG